MSNAWKAAKLDLSLVKPYIKAIGFAIFFPIVFVVIDRSLLVGVSFAMCLIAVMTGYPFSITEQNGMERLYGVLPAKKSELVIGRYLLVLALGAFTLTASLITQPIVLRAMGETVGVSDIVIAAVGGLLLFAIYTVFQIPGFYKFGSIKGRLFRFIPVIGYLVTLFLLPRIPAGDPFVTAIAGSPILLIALVMALIVIMYAVSICFSIRIMKNKEI